MELFFFYYYYFLGLPTQDLLLLWERNLHRLHFCFTSNFTTVLLSDKDRNQGWEAKHDSHLRCSALLPTNTKTAALHSVSFQQLPGLLLTRGRARAWTKTFKFGVWRTETDLWNVLNGRGS